MISHRTLATALFVAAGAVGGKTVATSALPSASLPPNDAKGTALSVVPYAAASAGGRADVVIRVDGAITLKHFTMSKPDKIVVDLSGATLGIPTGDSYDGVARGGIKSVRFSQFTKSTVRVVLTLDAPHPYNVVQSDGEVRVNVDGAGAKFNSWSIGSGAAKPRRQAMVSDATPPAPAPAAEMPAAPAPQKVVEAPAAPVTLPVHAESLLASERDLAPARTEAKEPQPLVFRQAEITTNKPVKTQQSQEPRINVNWENAPISDVIGVFAAFTGRTILPARGVTGFVTANITNLPWDVALKEVMNASGYDVTINPDGVIVIDTFENIAARQATIPLRNRTIRLNYARAKSVAPMVSERLTRTCPISRTATAGQGIAPPQGAAQQPGMAPDVQQPQVGVVQSFTCPTRGTVTADTITNSVTITDIPSALPDLEEYARSLDLRQPQVNIKAKIILVDRTTLEGLGLRYDLGTQQQFFNDIVPRLDSTGKPRTDAGQILLGGNTVSAIANATARIPSAALQLVYSTAMGNYNFTTFLEALQSNTLLDIQAEPSATVLNNRTANLTAGTQVPIRVIEAGAGSNNTGNFPRATVQMQQTGVILTVTPQITANHQIQMRVHVENSDVQFESNDVGAVFPKQSVDNEVLVADGETTVMGGLTQTSVSVSKTGLPVLVDLPIIGRLFGVTNRSETKRDLLILITPHIIDDGQSPDSSHP
ncbi:MAG TPA: AMIN domain-containing protein [Vicinamibacterales bacterium]|nr:AMIN domain-containing protein [Vicinamibacterales bacterium]